MSTPQNKPLWFLVSDGEHSEIVNGQREEVELVSFGGKWTSCTCGYETREKLMTEGKVLPSCSICSNPFGTNYCEPLGSMMRRENICFTCNFWRGMIAIADAPGTVRVAGTHYKFNAAQPIGKDRADFRGYGGAEFKIKFHDGRQVTTNSLWHQGKIPERWRDRLPDNAVFLK